MSGFRWTDERKATLRDLYLNRLMGPTEIAKALGDGCEPDAVSYAVRAYGMRRPFRVAAGGFTWTPEALVILRREWPDATQSNAQIAAQIGDGCTARAVTRKASLLRLERTGDRRALAPRPNRRGGGSVKGRTFRARPNGGRMGRIRSRALRFAALCLKSGWGVEETAWAFDLPVDEIAQISTR